MPKRTLSSLLSLSSLSSSSRTCLLEPNGSESPSSSSATSLDLDLDFEDGCFPVCWRLWGRFSEGMDASAGVGDEDGEGEF